MLALYCLIALPALYLAGRAFSAYADLVVQEHVTAALGPKPGDVLFLDSGDAPEDYDRAA